MSNFDEQKRLRAAQIAEESRKKRESEAVNLRPRIQVANIPQEIWEKIVSYSHFDEQLAQWVQAVSFVREKNPLHNIQTTPLNEKGEVISMQEFVAKIGENVLSAMPIVSIDEKKARINALMTEYSNYSKMEIELFQGDLDVKNIEQFFDEMRTALSGQIYCAWEMAKMIKRETNKIVVAKWLTIIIELRVKLKLLFQNSIRKYTEQRGITMYFVCWYLKIRNFEHKVKAEVNGEMIEETHQITVKTDKCLWYSSKVGRGKTTLMQEYSSIMNEYDRWENYGLNPNGVHFKEMDILNYEPDTLDTILKYSKDLYIFDDLFKDEKVRYTDLFAKILRKRYSVYDNLGTRTIIITNEKFDVTKLQERYGAADESGSGVDRLRQMFYEISPNLIKESFRTL